MTTENKMWEEIKADYLQKVAKALDTVKHPRSKEVLEDVSSHLDQRFADIAPEQQNWETLNTIITEMGPASDYAELLETGAVRPNRKFRSKYFLWIGIGIVICAVAIFLPTVKEHKHLTISRAYWFHSDQRPSSIPANAVPKDDDGHVLFHIDEWFEQMGTSKQYRPFLNQVDGRFILKADGHPDVQANAERGCWSQEFYIRIPKREYVKMEAGVKYTVHPVNSNPKYQWKVVSGVIICKPIQ